MVIEENLSCFLKLVVKRIVADCDPHLSVAAQGCDDVGSSWCLRLEWHCGPSERLQRVCSPFLSL